LTSDFYAVIPAGGSGTRLWPLSRSQEPKFLLDLLGTGHSLLQETVNRLTPFVEPSRVFVVTGEAHESAVKTQLPLLPSENVLVEPSPKNSAAAVGLAAFVLATKAPDAIVGFFAADHVITDSQAFHEVLKVAIAAAETDLLVTIGITPTEPSSAFGYIKVGSESSLPTVCEVSQFVEKPSFRDAQEFVDSGDYLWNAGIFVGRVQTVVDVFEEFAPDLASGLRGIAGQLLAGEEFSATWRDLQAEAFDYVIAEPAARAGKFLVVPGDFGWRDVGDFASLAQARDNGGTSDVVVVGDSAKVHPHDSSGIVVGSSGRVITLLGVKDIVIVDTPDALLVTNKEHVQDVKKVVDLLRITGEETIL
jgi:mannose-1-phosphate guanylyltransferase